MTAQLGFEFSHNDVDIKNLSARNFWKKDKDEASIKEFHDLSQSLLSALKQEKDRLTKKGKPELLLKIEAGIEKIENLQKNILSNENLRLAYKHLQSETNGLLKIKEFHSTKLEKIIHIIHKIVMKTIGTKNNHSRSQKKFISTVHTNKHLFLDYPHQNKKRSRVLDPKHTLVHQNQERSHVQDTGRSSNPER